MGGFGKCERCGSVIEQGEKFREHDRICGQAKTISELKAEIERLEAELAHVRKERREETELYIDMTKRCDEARSAARELAGYRPLPQLCRKNWIKRFPWLGGGG